MAKKITLDAPHAQGHPAVEYTLVKLIVQYEADTAIVLLKDQNGRQHQVKVSPAPATTQEQAILALINNGVLSGTIGNA